MSQRGPVPDVETPDWLLVQHMPDDTVALLGSRQRGDEIVLGTDSDRPTYASQDAVDLSICSVSIEIKHRQARSLLQEFFVGHFQLSPHWSQGQSGTTVALPTLNFHVADNFRFRDASCSEMGTQKCKAALRAHGTAS